MTRDLLTALCIVLAVSTASAYGSYRNFRFTPDDQWHGGFMKGYTACWDYHQIQNERAADEESAALGGGARSAPDGNHGDNDFGVTK